MWPTLRPDSAQVIVVEDDAGQIAGCWAVFPAWHVEGLYVAPEHRHTGTVTRRLLSEMRRVVRLLGVDSVVTCAVSDEVRDLIQRVGGVPLPGTSHALPLGRD